MNDHMADASDEQQNEYQYQLDVHVRITGRVPLFSSSEKVIHEATWINQHGSPIVILQLNGPTAEQEASYYLRFNTHPHIIKTFGRVQNDQNLIMLLQERSPKPDLFEILRHEDQFKPTEEVFCTIFKQICEAVIFLLETNIAHGDLACRNILVFHSDPTSPEKNLVKLTDFGLAQQINDNGSDHPSTAIIPKHYAAPELLQSENRSRHSEKSEVYSMGMLMWQACSHGEVPYGSIEDDDDDVKQIKINDERLPRPSICSDQLWTIIDNCLDVDPTNRPSFRSLNRRLSDLIFPSHSQSKVSPRATKVSLPSLVCHPSFPLVSLTGIGFEERRAVDHRRGNARAFDGTSRPILCFFCHQSLPSRHVFEDHLVSYAEKTEECPYCHRFVLRTIYNDHTEHNCVGITGKNIVSNGLHQLRTAFPSRNRMRAIDPTRKSIFDPASPQCQNGLHENEKNASQSRRLTKDRCSQSRKVSAHHAQHLPVCGKSIEKFNYSTHIKSCLARDQHRNKIHARQPVADPIPCQHCRQLYPENQLSLHQTYCLRSPRKLALTLRDNRQQRFAVLPVPIIAPLSPVTRLRTTIEVPQPRSQSSLIYRMDRAYLNTLLNKTRIDHQDLRPLNTNRYNGYHSSRDQERSRYSNSPTNTLFNRELNRNRNNGNFPLMNDGGGNAAYEFEHNQSNDYRPSRSKYIPARNMKGIHRLDHDN